MSVIGSLKHSGQVEDAVIDRLREWSSTYLAEVEDQHGYERGFAERLRAIVPISELSRFPEEQLPAAFVISPGTDDPPARLSTGFYEASFSVGVMVVVSAVTEADTRRLAQLYGAAVRGCMVQGRSLGGVAEATTWAGESLDDVPVDERRTLQASINLFSVVLGDVVSWKGGPVQPAEPPVPDTDELPDWPQAETVTVQVDHKEEG